MDFFRSRPVALYARAGFEECEPFGRLPPDPLSTFMTLRSTGLTGVARGPPAPAIMDG